VPKNPESKHENYHAGGKMKSRRNTVFLMLGMILLLIIPAKLSAGNIIIEGFDGYFTNDALKAKWTVSGEASKDIAIDWDITGLIAPSGNFMKYTYNAANSTWGGLVEPVHTGANAGLFPLDLTGANAGLQFYLKGDGTSNTICFRFYDYFSDGTEAVWQSQPISLKNDTWEIVRVPFVVDTDKQYGLHLFSTTGAGQGTKLELARSLGHIGRFQIVLDNPNKSDTQDHSFYLDEFRAVDFFPPNAPEQYCLEDFEGYPDTGIFKTAWQGFGYPTRDYVLWQMPDSPEGYRNAYWLYNADQTTTWGMAFRTRAGIISNLDISHLRDGGVQFLLKGDGTDNKFLFRWTDTQNNYWGSNWISIKDTTWHWVSVPFVVDTLDGFRWLGNDPNGTYWTPNIGTIDDLQLSLTRINEIRMDIRFPVIDNTYRALQIDAIYAVSRLPAKDPVAVDDFENYIDSEDLKLSWNQFGTGSIALDLNGETSTSGLHSMTISYNGSTGYTAVRKRNILPALNFAKMKGGIQFWLKGDGTSNRITFRLQNGNEMWESYPIPLKDTSWKLWAVKFIADSTTGFRYLGNNPDNPVWSSNVGTKAQLYGDLASIDQVRFYLRNPQTVDQGYSFSLDRLEGVDEIDKEAIVSAVQGKNLNQQPDLFELEQNYPNPFNPVTTIAYSLASPGHVKIEVFNVLGQRVKTLVDANQSAGAFKVQFDASEVTSGLYFYQLTVDNVRSTGAFTRIKRMLVLK